MNYDRWWIALLFGAFTVVLGVILVRNPFKVVNTVVRVIGAFLVYDGLSDAWIISRIFKTRKDKETVIDAEAVEIED